MKTSQSDLLLFKVCEEATMGCTSESRREIIGKTHVLLAEMFN